MGITDVVRGRDLADSTARQILLHRTLTSDRATPIRWAHHGLIMGAAGAKLSKRDQAPPVSELREMGVSAEEVIATVGRAFGVFGPTIHRATAMDFAAGLADMPRVVASNTRLPP